MVTNLFPQNVCTANISTVEIDSVEISRISEAKVLEAAKKIIEHKVSRFRPYIVSERTRRLSSMSIDLGMTTHDIEHCGGRRTRSISTPNVRSSTAALEAWIIQCRHVELPELA